MKAPVLRRLSLLLAVTAIGVLAGPWHPVSAQEEPGFTQLVRIDYLERTVSREQVTPGEQFYATVKTRVTLARKFNIPWEVVGEYEAYGIHQDSGQEVVLGHGTSQAGPFGELQAGDSLTFEEQVILTFPGEAPLGKYTLYIRPVRVSPWYFWLAVEALTPGKARLGEVELVPPPTPTPSPTPTATPTPIPTPIPTVVPPTPAPPAGGAPWQPIALVLLVLLVGGGAVVLWRRAS